MSRYLDVLIADDEPDVRDHVRRALAANPRLRVVAEARDGAQAWELVQRLVPRIAIVDIGMPQLDGIALLRKIRDRRLPVSVIFLTVCDEEPVFDVAFELGVKGYLLKHYSSGEILKCVEAVAAGGHCASPPVLTHIIDRSHRLERLLSQAGAEDDLTLQERAILRRVQQRKSSKEIASELGISTRTVHTHRSNICKKLGIHGNYGLNRYAKRGGA